jgi:hypothetical protein
VRANDEVLPEEELSDLGKVGLVGLLFEGIFSTTAFDCELPVYFAAIFVRSSARLNAASVSLRFRKEPAEAVRS